MRFTALTFLAVALATGSACALPQLKTQAELIADGLIKAKVLAGSEGVPMPTPQAQLFRVTSSGGKDSRDVRLFSPRDLWYKRAFVGEWRDAHGNVMRLLRVRSLIPKFNQKYWYEAEIEKALDDLEKKFAAKDPPPIPEWKLEKGGSIDGAIIETKVGIFYVEFEFAEKVKPADYKKLLKQFEKSVSTMTSGSSGAIQSMKWWEEANPLYKFFTDLDRAKGGKFISDSMKQMSAMRKAYEYYVPPRGKVDQCVVRIFKTLEGYRNYRASCGADDKRSCGLWDPARAELLISAEDREFASSIMRHEAFHQYLHYASRSGIHAQWFNEGHATFFENIEYNSAKNTVRITDKGNRADWVSRNPERVAKAIRSVLKLNHEQFYKGDANLHYVTAWAIIYFLERGSYTTPEFSQYRAICPVYLDCIAQGMDCASATEKAWELVAKRDVEADFLKFWSKYRKLALTARERDRKDEK